MIGVNDVIKRIIDDLICFNLGIKGTQYTWNIQDKEAIVAAELDGIVIDSCRSDGFKIIHQSENWSIVRFRKPDAPKATKPISIKIRNRKIENIEETVMDYRYQGSMDDIIAWCLAIKLAMNY